MSQYPFILEKYNRKTSRHTCPECHHRLVFTRYIFTETGEYIDDSVGRCNRENKCGYHYPPKQYFFDNNIRTFKPSRVDTEFINPVKSLDTSYIDIRHLHSNMKNYEQNNFARFLKNEIPVDLANEVLLRYNVGTSNRWSGATLFWQIDGDSNIRTGKIMLYDANTGRRVKQPYNHLDWAHSSRHNFSLTQCLFGEHLLKKNPFKTVGIVESEKTAIIASAYLPNYVWVAVGGISNLNPEICIPLKRRQIEIFPDGDGYEKWKQKAIALSAIGDVEVSDLLEKKLTAEEKYHGIDLADYLLRFECDVA